LSEEPLSVPDRLLELPEGTRKFLAKLDDDEIEILEDGIRLVAAIRTVGSVARWMIVGLCSLVLGTVMLLEAIDKLTGRVWPK